MAERRSRFRLPARRAESRLAEREREPAPEVSMESRPAPIAEAVERSAVDAGIYREGKRIASPATVADAVRSLRDEPGSMAWIGLFRPAESQLLAMADEFGLHEVAVEDAIVAHHLQAPRLAVSEPARDRFVGLVLAFAHVASCWRG